jgi:2-polyprenyl-3-methyl-5-hydroxy-6-metoxy-1,4-benzoquinol methylase
MTGYFNSCLLCNSTRLSHVNKEKKPWLVKCRNCSFVFSEKIPTLKELQDYYVDYTDYDFVNDLTRNRYLQWIDGFEPDRVKNKILDVGCGDGIFLDQAIKRGWNVYGTEYADKWITRCSEKGIHMAKGKLNADDYEPESFDVISYLEVIEHINNPIEELSIAKKLLRKGGVVFITTPNYNSLMRYFLGTDWNIITYPEHLSYYTPRTLNLLFKKTGFEKIKIDTKGVSPGRLVTSMRTRGNEKINSTDKIRDTDQNLRIKLESNAGMRLVKNSINQILNWSRSGDSMHAWFRSI